MAIDSPAKRRAVAGIPFLPLGPGITPTTNKNRFWRSTVAWGYYFQTGGSVDGRPIHLFWESQAVRTSFSWTGRDLILTWNPKDLEFVWIPIREFP